MKSRKKKRWVLHQYNLSYILYKYHSHFFHSLISCGNKLRAFNFFLDVKYGLKIRICADPLILFHVAIYHCVPEVLLFPLKKASNINEVALPITIRKQIIFATKWVIKLLKDKYRILNVQAVVDILYDSGHNDGLIIEKKKLIYLLAEKKINI